MGTNKSPQDHHHDAQTPASPTEYDLEDLSVLAFLKRKDVQPIHTPEGKDATEFPKPETWEKLFNSKPNTATASVPVDATQQNDTATSNSGLNKRIQNLRQEEPSLEVNKANKPS